MKHWRALTAVCLSTMKKRAFLRGVVFDMDGTLTLPNLNFDEMYRRCGVDRNHDILQVLASLPAEEAKPKYAIIEDMEEEALRTMKLMPGAKEVISWFKAHRIPTAVVTRNTHRSAKALEEHLFSFDIIIARDCQQNFPPKPHPAAMHYIASEWKLDPSSIVMVGDSLCNDIVFGQRAGAVTALIDMGRKSSEDDKTQAAAEIVVEHLSELPRQLWLNFDIDGELGTHTPLKKHKAPTPTSATTRAAAEGNVDGILPKEANLPDETGNTPLIWAADAGHTNVISHLLNQGNVNVNVRGYLGATAVCRAARRGHGDILKQLIRAGADLDVPNEKMQYPLHFAAFKENMAAVQTLLESGVNTRVLDRKGRIPAEDTSNEDIRATIHAAMGLTAPDRVNCMAS